MKPPRSSTSLSSGGTQVANNRSQENSSFQAPTISLPKGGGAIRGIGEKFAANPVTGTGSMSIPISTSPSRAGFGPQLSLDYDSGAGNGPFGIGWHLSLSAITRKTDKGLPRYFDAEESDVFILSGAEDLVPVLVKNGDWAREQLPVRPVNGANFRIDRYRPRIEGLFARIERWTNVSDATDIRWRSISKDNLTTWYGSDASSRIVDPSDPSHIFSWLICQTYDDKGNVMTYEYVPDDSQGVDLDRVQECNRTDTTRGTQRYLRRIRYGNRTPYFPDFGPAKPVTPLPAEKDWMFSVIFDYGEGRYQTVSAVGDDPQLVHATVDPAAPLSGWPVRQDPFSSYRSCFEVRTHRLCRRVLMFHHFPTELKTPACLVRSTEFTFQEDPVGSFISSVVQSGYVRLADKDPRQTGDIYLKKSLPQLEFGYTKAEISTEILDVDPSSLENLPVGLDGNAYQWVDLDGEGLKGVLGERAGAWYYKRNLSALPQPTAAGPPEVRACFAPVESVSRLPATVGVSGRRHQFLDLAGDGNLDVVEFGGPTPGFYERTLDENWKSFSPFGSLPDVAWDDPNLRFVDLTGDGFADVLITEDNVFTYYPSLAEVGFDEAERVYQPFDEEAGPRLVVADATVSISVADMSGDGLSDVVRVRNGEVCYWPNLGYGRFGAKVTMDNSPWFDLPDHLDPKRLRLADIDGSGTTDLIYLGRNRITIYRNLAGNSFSDPEPLDYFPPVDNLAAVQACDLLGNGTACLVWSSPLSADASRPMRYIDLMGGQKPHLLVSMINNLGAETNIQYAPSTKFYLADRLAGNPWITRLAFPVHVVERVETIDRISRNRFTTRYAYHHGYFDGVEREFRGFGMVEQWDTDALGLLTQAGVLPVATNLDASSYVPPVHTKTWFHTGVFIDRKHISNFFAGLTGSNVPGEYFREPGLTDDEAVALLLPDTILPAGLSADDEREACRSLKGSMLRREIYSDDSTAAASRPYSVTEQNFTIELVQPEAGQRHAVFFAHPREQIDFHYERQLYPYLNGNPIDAAAAQGNPNVEWLADPRVTHALTLAVDAYGNVLQSAAVAYGRRLDAPEDAGHLLTPIDLGRQKLNQITVTENSVTNAFDDPVGEPDVHRRPLPAESTTFEISKMTPAAVTANLTNLFQFEELQAKLVFPADGTRDLPYEDWEAKGAVKAGPYRRPIERMRTLYRKDDLTGLLPFEQLESLALPGEAYKLAFTPGLLDQVYLRPHPVQAAESLLPDPAGVLGSQAGDGGGYVDLDGDKNWWIPSGRIFYSPTEGDSPAKELKNTNKHFFLPQRYHDPFGAVATVTFDAYDLLILEIEDALGNRVIAGERDAKDFVTPGNDYRVLQPAIVSDPNRNRVQVAFDGLGLVAGTAVMGKPEENLGDSLDGFAPDLTQTQIDNFFADPLGQAAGLLRTATTRIIYDLACYVNGGGPTFAATLARETHVSDPLPAGGTRIQVGFSYSDGFGREIQKKLRAEAGPLDPSIPSSPNIDPRWVGSGWTIFNNKGKPVRKYEPFFSPTHGFEAGRKVGVSSTLFYDPVERVVATLHPNGTYEKVTFDPWRQVSWDLNDTVSLDPRTDPDVEAFFVQTDGTSRLPDDEYLPLWYALRTDPAQAAAAAGKWPDPNLLKAEKSAAAKAAAHAGTPAIGHLDSLGRTFVSFADNGPDPAQPAKHLYFAARTLLDIEGNQREVRDAVVQNGDLQGRIVMQYSYDMLSHRIYQLSMEAGARWMLNDVLEKPIRHWDNRDHTFRTEYDPLRRPVRSYAIGADPDKPADEFLVERQAYGEQLKDAESVNLLGRLYLHLDQSGAVQNDGHDFKGNLVAASRRIAIEYRLAIDWSTVDAKIQKDPTKPIVAGNLQTALDAVLESDSYASRTAYDALNRAIQLIAPHASARCSVIQHVFNEANLLNGIDVWLDQAADPGEMLDPTATAPSAVGVKNIDYDAKGQRLLIVYSNGAQTDYTYDSLTFRLTHLLTRRKAAAFPGDDPHPVDAAWPGACAQNLSYTYDPVGNITAIRDDAQQTIYFKNARVEPSAEYTYDAIYRLVEATGREHLGQIAAAPQPTSYNDWPRVNIPHPADGKAMGIYRQTYVYDEVGNFNQMIHVGTDPANAGWTRNYSYNEASLLEPTKRSNRLTSTAAGPAHGLKAPDPYAYDVHGNMLKMAHLQEMRWDFKDQLQMTRRQKVNQNDADGVVHDGEKTWYRYDARGQRVRKLTESGNQTPIKERVYLGGFEVYREYGTNGTAVKLERETLHVMDDKQRIALVETRTAPTGLSANDPLQLIRYQFGNHLGSASVELNDKAKVISYEEYYPYGSTSYQAVRSQIKSPKRYRYTAMERDKDNGLNYHNARYFSPWLGRWVAADPSGLSDGPNLYMYVQAKPLRRIDPTGHLGKPSTQMSFYEHRVYHARAVATATGSGFTATLKQYVQKVYAIWGGKGKADIGHIDRPLAESPAGHENVVGPQDPIINRGFLAQLDKARVAIARLGGKFTRRNRVDLQATKGFRPPAPEQPALFNSPEIMNRNLGTPPMTPSAMATIPRSVTAPPSPSQQLELPFAQAAQSAETTASSTSPGIKLSLNSSAGLLPRLAGLTQVLGTVANVAIAINDLGNIREQYLMRHPVLIREGGQIPLTVPGKFHGLPDPTQSVYTGYTVEKSGGRVIYRDADHNEVSESKALNYF